MSVGKLVKSNPHTDYTCQIYNPIPRQPRLQHLRPHPIGGDTHASSLFIPSPFTKGVP